MALAVALVGCEGGASAEEKDGGAGAGGDAGVVKADAATHPPVLQLVDDAKSTEDGKSVVVAVLTNDTFSKGGAHGEPFLKSVSAPEYVLTLDSKPRHGTATLSGTRVTYTPAPTYVGEDDFMYKVKVKGSGAGALAKPLEGTAVVRVTMNTAAPAPTKPRTRTAPKAETGTAAGAGAGAEKPAAQVYFKNCTAVRAADAAPIRTGDPGYANHLDRDGDGVGCES
ncbi:excalibur calcium-binding domain-containing protein [Streptomyces sp. NPDC091272]|uniref:excalibur calcium-binding domain-containing protein n=1 Tax=Streptomyces sp. NPDC091272 TaxID=3365981 RepID=UPI0037F5EEAD